MYANTETGRTTWTASEMVPESPQCRRSGVEPDSVITAMSGVAPDATAQVVLEEADEEEEKEETDAQVQTSTGTL